jgi:hypothetical protein
MRIIAIAGVVAVLAVPVQALDTPQVPTPTKEHNWLQQLAGEWETEAEIAFEPGKPPVKCKGTESVRLLGGFWIVSEMKSEFMGTPMTGVMTVGYDAKTKKYVGTWVCSACDWLCKYEGSVSGNTLTLECEGPDPTTGKVAKMKDVMEVKDKDTRVLTSYIQGEDGKWTRFMTMTAKRKK